MFHVAERFLKTQAHIFQDGHRDPGVAWAVTLEGNMNGQCKMGERGKSSYRREDWEKGEGGGRRRRRIWDKRKNEENGKKSLIYAS